MNMTGYDSDGSTGDAKNVSDMLYSDDESYSEQDSDANILNEFAEDEEVDNVTDVEDREDDEGGAEDDEEDKEDNIENQPAAEVLDEDGEGGGEGEPEPKPETDAKPDIKTEHEPEEVRPHAAIDPELWGPSFWSTLHWCAAGYPDQPSPLDKVSYNRFIMGMLGVLPCPTCREHFAKMLEKYPLHNALNSGNTLRLWGLRLHNAVNKETGSDEVWTLRKLLEHYPLPGQRLAPTLRSAVKDARADKADKADKADAKAVEPVEDTRQGEDRGESSTPRVRAIAAAKPMSERLRRRLIARSLAQQTNFLGRISTAGATRRLTNVRKRLGGGATDKTVTQRAITVSQRATAEAVTATVNKAARSVRPSGGGTFHPTAILNRNNQIVRQTVSVKRKKKGCGCGAK